METPLTIQQHTWVREALFVVDDEAKDVGWLLGRLTHEDRLDDLKTVGKLALYDAVRLYDETRGEFPPFARCRVRGAILRSVKRERRAERIEIAMGIAGADRMARYEWDKWNVLDTDEQQAEAYLAKVCEALAVTMFVAGAEEARREAEDDPVAARVDYAHTILVLHALVRALKPPERELLELVYGQGLEQREVAARLGVHKDTVWLRHKRLLVKLQHELRMREIKEAPCPRNDILIPQLLPGDPRRPKRQNDA